MGVIMSGEAKPGTYLEMDGIPFLVMEYAHVKPGKGGAFVRLKLRNLKQGTVIDRNVGAGERLNTADVEEKEMQFLYRQGEEFVFMDQETYDQLHLTQETLGEKVYWLKEEMRVSMLMFKHEPLDIKLPLKVELKITQTEPAVKGNTVNNATKEAILETGAKIQVPMFVEAGTTVRIDTRTGEYLERV